MLICVILINVIENLKINNVIVKNFLIVILNWLRWFKIICVKFGVKVDIISFRILVRYRLGVLLDLVVVIVKVKMMMINSWFVLWLVIYLNML